MEDPAEWAKYRVKKYGAELITLHMVSTDPKQKDTPIKEACKTIEDVLQAVKVPVIIGGSGNPKKEPGTSGKSSRDLRRRESPALIGRPGHGLQKGCQSSDRIRPLSPFTCPHEPG